jgi:GNAT superfamily N-acetyltransferase
MQGWLAYADGVPVGWCNAAPRPLLRALDDEPIPDAEQVGAIVCFLVEPSHRGRGIARQLLEAACEGLREQGLRFAEGNPAAEAASAAENHCGPLSLYLSAGFSVHREDEDGSVYVRRALVKR